MAEPDHDAAKRFAPTVFHREAMNLVACYRQACATRDAALRMADQLRGCLANEHEDDGDGFCKGCERHMGEINEHDN